MCVQNTQDLLPRIDFRTWPGLAELLTLMLHPHVHGRTTSWTCVLVLCTTYATLSLHSVLEPNVPSVYKVATFPLSQAEVRPLMHCETVDPVFTPKNLIGKAEQKAQLHSAECRNICKLYNIQDTCSGDRRTWNQLRYFSAFLKLSKGLKNTTAWSICSYFPNYPFRG